MHLSTCTQLVSGRARTRAHVIGVTPIPVLSPGPVPPSTPAYEGDRLLIPLASGFFLGMMRPGWETTALRGRRTNAAKRRTGIWMAGTGLSVEAFLGRKGAGSAVSRLSSRRAPTKDMYYLLSLCYYYTPNTRLHIHHC